MSKITVSKERFHYEWKSTGYMIRESPTTLIQTYSHPRFEGKFKQIGLDGFLGGVILESVEEKLAFDK